MPESGISGFSTFGDLLKYLRKRAQLTQRELAIAVGYSEAHLSRLETNQRLPDLATTAALLLPALGLEDEPETAARLMQLAADAHRSYSPTDQSLTLAHRRETVEVSESSESIPSNLPLQLSSFIGRQAEINEITELLSCDKPARLVTLVGPGGIGKTRLALQTTIELLPRYPDGIWFVDLARISSPDLIPQTTASIFAVKEMPGQSIVESLVSFLRSKHALILLDNCEHLIQAAAETVETVLRACPLIQILATSREPLTTPGEVVFRLQPLSLPDPFAPQNALRHDSVRLFLERAHNIQSPFVVTDSNLPVIARICRRLDGMPLAIELAAAVIDFLSLTQIESHLDDRFDLLTRGQRTLPRHQTLRATIEWSHDLLTELERLLFRRLSVFVGGWTLEAANHICAESDHPVVDLLGRLVHKSLVTAELRVDAEARYGMLETIREYGREELHAAGESEQIRARHFEYFFTMLQQGEENLFAAESSIDWAEQEIDNIRAALAWTLEKAPNRELSEERAGRGLELMPYIWPLWLSRGYSLEGDEWLSKLLSVHTASTPARARALLVAGDLAGLRGDYARQAAYIHESLALARELGDTKQIAWALMETGLIERDRNYLQAVHSLTQSLELFQELKEDLWVCRTSFLLAQTHMAYGNLGIARSLWEQGLEICRERNDQWQIAWGLEGLGDVERLEERFAQARTFYRQSLELKVLVKDKAGMIYSLEAFAQLAAAQEQYKRAAVLWGASEGQRQTLNLLTDPVRGEFLALPIAKTRTALGETAFSAAWTEGKTMTREAAIEYALTPSSI